jgi:hypothetical protein
MTWSSAPFTIYHPSFKVSNHNNDAIPEMYRWVAYAYQQEMIHDPKWGLCDSLLPLLKGDPVWKKRTPSLDKRIDEWIAAVGLPPVSAPVLYVEIGRLLGPQAPGTGPSMIGEFTNLNKGVKAWTGHLTSAVPRFPAPVQSASNWNTWWKPIYFDRAAIPTTSPTIVSRTGVETLVNTKAGQASGAHRLGWRARGGRGIHPIGNHKLGMHGECIDCLTGTCTGKHNYEQVHFNRPGFILFSLVRGEDLSNSIVQGDPDAINPLAAGGFLDLAEKRLIDFINDRSIKIREDWKTALTKGKNHYPMESWAKNTHNLEDQFFKDGSPSIYSSRSATHLGPNYVYQRDMDTAADSLVNFLGSPSTHLCDKMIPFFRKRIHGGMI